MPDPQAEAIVYRTINGIELVGQLYRPARAGPTPFVVDAHGGAWGSGDRFNNAVIHADLAAHGIGVFAIDFRLSSQAQYPAPVDDINYALRWFKKNTVALGVEPKLIGGLGSSSGAQQMGLNVLRPDDPIYTTADPALDGVDASVAFFVACWPILDPLARYRMVQTKGIERLIAAHNAYFPNEAAMVSGNPYLVLERGEASHLPPMIILQGMSDSNVEHDRADRFAQRYRKAGGEVEVYKYADQPHTFITADPNSDAAKDAIVKIRQFILSQVP